MIRLGGDSFVGGWRCILVEGVIRFYVELGGGYCLGNSKLLVDWSFGYFFVGGVGDGIGWLGRFLNDR